MTETSKLLNWNDYLKTLKAFELKVLNALEVLGIRNDCQNLDIDHACIRFSTEEPVNAIRLDLKIHGEEVSCAKVNGRDIVIFRLSEAIQIARWQVDVLELPYPKQNQQLVDGWEHVEFVLPTAENSLGGLRQAFFKNFPSLEYDNLKAQYHYKEDAPHVIGEQLANPTVALKVEGVGLKFHANSILDVVRSG